ncbi:MAG: hypothetical protein MK180_16480 [Rhodobacteraceae bacterium]|nr:hypothetical protein [Paracoccaceae bacterium]
MDTEPSVMSQVLKNVMGWPQFPLEFPALSVDGERGVYRRLMDLSRQTDLGDIAVFWEDYHYMRLPRDLVRFVLPIALEAWARNLLNIKGLFTGNWHFEGMWWALADKPMHPDILDTDEAAAMEDFLSDVLLERMEHENWLLFDRSGASPYEWVELLATMLWHFPIAERFWDRWSRFAEPGHAVSYVQWISTLIYDDTANPFFKPWTPMEGGGPPAIFDRADLKNCAAAAENINVLQSALSFKRVEETLGHAAEMLGRHEQSEHVYEAWLDLSRRRAFFEARSKAFLAMMEDSKLDPSNGWEGN